MQQRSEETKVRILEAAQQLFAGGGYDATGVAEICKTAGVSKGAFYHHFPSKQAVFVTLLENWLAVLDRQMAFLLDGSESVAQGLVRAAGITGMVFQSASGQLPMFLEFWRAASHDPLVWQTTVGPFRRYQELFSNIVKKGIAEGSLRSVDPVTAARLIVALALGLILQGVIDPQGAAWDEVTRDSFQMLMKGLSK
ncbi:MAG TPA: TetR/AcrR family transcriptional regulator [Anaerolineaceae bacterium]|jgi:AcrR family transcriptional regulator